MYLSVFYSVSGLLLQLCRRYALLALLPLVCVYVSVCQINLCLLPFLLPGLTVHDSTALLLLTSTANRLQLLIAHQQDASSQSSRVKQLLTLHSHSLIASFSVHLQL